jgi:tubulin-specific chaperone C
VSLLVVGTMSAIEADRFLREFDTRVTTIRSNIDRSDTAMEIDAAACVDIDKLHEFLSASAYILPAYDIRRANEMLDELSAARQNKSEALTPRQPFRFRNRRVPVAGLVAIETRESVVEDRHLSDRQKTDDVAPIAGTGTARETVDDGLPGRGIEIKDRANEANIRVLSSKLRNRDVSLVRLRGCTVYLCDVASAVRGADLVDCRLYIGAVAGSVHLTGCVSCQVFVAARQVRIHASRDCTFMLRTTTGPIIEDSAQLSFGPYALRYPRSEAHISDAGLPDASSSAWKNVQDFSWLREGSSPNWCLLKIVDECSVQLDETGG